MIAGQVGLRVLALYIEPAPYILGLVRVLWSQQPSLRLKVLFIEKHATQPWQLRLDEGGSSVLPPRRSAAIRQIWHVIGAGQLDLVHLAGWGHPLLLVTMLLARWRGIPVVVESDTPLAVTTLPWQTRLKRFFHPLLLRLPAYFLPGGRRQARYLQSYGVPTHRMQIVQMTVDTLAIARYLASMPSEARRCLRGRFGIAAEATVYLFVGRLETYKGIVDLVSGFKRLRHLRSDVELLVVGDGSLRSAVAVDLVKDNGIHAMGRLQGPDLLDAYAVADVLVLPSHSESWGLVINEAMAASLPVIVTDVVGCIDDLVIDGQTGLVIPAADPMALCAAMECLVADPDRRRWMGEQARAHIQGWTLENEADKVVRAWRRVLGA